MATTSNISTSVNPPAWAPRGGISACLDARGSHFRIGNVRVHPFASFGAVAAERQDVEGVAVDDIDELVPPGVHGQFAQIRFPVPSPSGTDSRWAASRALASPDPPTGSARCGCGTCPSALAMLWKAPLAAAKRALSSLPMDVRQDHRQEDAHDQHHHHQLDEREPPPLAGLAFHCCSLLHRLPRSAPSAPTTPTDSCPGWAPG